MRNYLYVIRMDGDMCGIREYELVALETAEPGELSQFDRTAHEMAMDHVCQFIDQDQYEEETGTEMEVDSEVFLYTPEKWGDFYSQQEPWHEREGYNAIQDENGYWYTTKGVY